MYFASCKHWVFWEHYEGLSQSSLVKERVSTAAESLTAGFRNATELEEENGYKSYVRNGISFKGLIPWYGNGLKGTRGKWIETYVCVETESRSAWERDNPHEGPHWLQKRQKSDGSSVPARSAEEICPQHLRERPTQTHTKTHTYKKLTSQPLYFPYI